MKNSKIKTSVARICASVFAAIAALTLLLPGLTTKAYANSGAPWSEGVDSMGISTLYSWGVLEVESENLTFNIKNGPNDLTDGEVYDASVTAEYAFYNPTDETVTTQFAFPYGNKPEMYTIENEAEIENPVTVNGEPVECEVRYTYGDYYDFSEQVAEIKSIYTEKDFYKRTTPVYEYNVKCTPEDDISYLYLSADVSGVDKSKTRFLALADSKDTIELSVYSSMETTFYVIGEEYDVNSLEWKTVTDSRYYGTEVSAVVTVTEVKEYTLEEYFASLIGEQENLNELDRWNICIEALSEADNYSVICDGRIPDSYAFEYSTCSWYTYQVTAAPGERFTNCVTAPIYPKVYNNYSGGYYEYTYYLSPAKSWASFKNLTININTDMYLQDADADGTIDFESTETGYTAFLEVLPDDELVLSLSTEENPVYTYNYEEEYTDVGLSVVLVFIFVIFPILKFVAAAIVIPVVLIKNKKRYANGFDGDKQD